MTEWAQKNTVQCEVVKVAMAQDRNGHILKLSIHPNDLPKDLVLDPLGSRYVMVLAKLNDQDEVVQPKEKSEGEKAVDIAGLLCRNTRFIEWLASLGYSSGPTAHEAADAIRSFCGIKSRAELAVNEEARRAFNSLKLEFESALKAGDVKK
jgi:hypothetical protein